MPTTPPSGTLSNPSSTPSDGPRNRPWPRTISRRWSAPSPADLAATYDQHAILARWLSDHAPEDVTNELAAASDRAHHARVAGRDGQSAEADVSALVAAQRCRDEWVMSHRDEITTWSRLDADVRRYEYRLGQVASYVQPEHVTALIGPLSERVGHAERWQSAAGAIEAYRLRWNVVGATTLGPEPADPEQRGHWDTTVALVGTAGFLTAGDICAGGSERAALAAKWEGIHTTDRERKDDFSMAQSPIPLLAPLEADEPYIDHDLDDGFGF